jgi:hypothetical protein
MAAEGVVVAVLDDGAEKEKRGMIKSTGEVRALLKKPQAKARAVLPVP